MVSLFFQETGTTPINASGRRPAACAATPVTFSGKSLKRAPTMVQNVDLSNGKEYIKKQEKCCRKTRQCKHGGHNTILERWHKDDEYRKSLSKNGWTEEQIVQYDKLALEDHSYVAIKEERIRNRKGWVLKLYKEAAQGPMNQRLDFADAKREFKRLHDEHAKETYREIRPFLLNNKQDSEEINNSKDLKNMIIKLILARDGERIL